MAFFVGSFYQLGELVYVAAVAAVDEEGCSGAVVGEDVQYSGCVDVWAIVEC